MMLGMKVMKKQMGFKCALDFILPSFSHVSLIMNLLLML